MSKHNELIEQSDYVIVRNVPYDIHLFFKKIDYLLKPDTFKFCLIRSKNTKLYAKYYILLEKCIYFIMNINYNY